MAGPHREPPPGERQGFGHDSRTIMNRKQRRRREKEDKAAEKPTAALLQRVAGFFDQGRLSEALKLCRQAVKKNPGTLPPKATSATSWPGSARPVFWLLRRAIFIL